MTQRVAAMPHITPEIAPPTKYVRNRAGKYEYGHIIINHVDRSKDQYVSQGCAASMAAAMKSNKMETL